jgi:hypothetical protein
MRATGGPRGPVADLEAAQREIEQARLEAAEIRHLAREELAKARAEADRLRASSETPPVTAPPVTPAPTRSDAPQRAADPGRDEVEEAEPSRPTSDEGMSLAERIRGQREGAESRYSRQSAKLPRLGDSAGSVLSSMAGLRAGEPQEEPDDEE